MLTTFVHVKFVLQKSQFGAGRHAPSTLFFKLLQSRIVEDTEEVFCLPLRAGDHTFLLLLNKVLVGHVAQVSFLVRATAGCFCRYGALSAMLMIAEHEAFEE